MPRRWRAARQRDHDAEVVIRLGPDDAGAVYWRRQGDGNSLLQLIDQVSLYSLRTYLAGSDKISVFHNRDDLMLSPGDLGFLRRTFGERMTLFPRGGHCGNLNYRVNTQAMLEFFRG